ncbi:MAG TPA: hypothetical protein VER04_27555 [Polyangiaceae bacterium]|nr:hypothetical protein [Polyangiaceae bacterium]
MSDLSDLSLDGKALVKAARQADRPSAADRERVLAALQAHLGDAAVLSSGLAQAPAGPAGAGVSRWPFLKWGWVGSTVLAAGALWLVPRISQHDQKAMPAPSASASASAPSVTTSEPETAAASSAPEVPAGPSALVAAASSSRSVETQKGSPRVRDGLTEEVALLSRAETELRAGRPAKALVALAEHQRKFPRGALAEERTAARIQALCALGRSDEANAQLRQLRHISPNSAHEERARQACRDPRAAP